MLRRVEADPEPNHVDVVLDFAADKDPNWPDVVEMTGRGSNLQVRLRLHPEELQVLAAALDTASTGGSGELYFSLKGAAAATPTSGKRS